MQNERDHAKDDYGKEKQEKEECKSELHSESKIVQDQKRTIHDLSVKLQAMEKRNYNQKGESACDSWSFYILVVVIIVIIIYYIYCKLYKYDYYSSYNYRRYRMKILYTCSWHLELYCASWLHDFLYCIQCVCLVSLTCKHYLL